jgi:hypothetical protein
MTICYLSPVCYMYITCASQTQHQTGSTELISAFREYAQHLSQCHSVHHHKFYLHRLGLNPRLCSERSVTNCLTHSHGPADSPIYRVCINYRKILLRHNLSRKCHKIVKFVSITHSERNIWNGPIVATAISREKRKPVLEENGCLTDRA